MNRPLTARCAATAAALCIIACSGTDKAPGNDAAKDECAAQASLEPLAAGSSQLGENGVQVELVALIPEPVARFENTWSVRVSDASARPRDDAQITVTPWMPSHRHGSGRAVAVTPSGSGTFELAPIDLWMPGYWEVQLTLALPEVEDAVVFGTCVPE